MAETKTEDGTAFPASDYCYVPDAAAPSTWKLRTTSTPGGKADPAIVGAAAAALGPGGFRGNPVEIPSADRGAVVACVRRAWREANPDKDAADMPAGLNMRSTDEPAPEPLEHLPAEVVEPVADVEEVRHFTVPVEEIEVRDLAKREVDMRLLPWGKQIDTVLGPEEFTRGAFAGTDPLSVYLYGTGHEIRLGMGQDGTPQVVRVPIGRAMSLTDNPDGQHATFKVARTAGGDEALALMADKIVSGVSLEFAQVTGGTSIEQRSGRRVRIHNRARLMGATPTHRPAYGEQAAVLSVRSQAEGDAPMGDTVAAPEVGAPVDATPDRILAAFDAIEARAAAQQAISEKFLERFEKLEEQARSSFSIPNPLPEAAKPKISKGDWVQTVVRLMTGERIPEVQMRDLADVITTDNAGVVPPAFLTELIGVIDASRPFLSSTRRLEIPSSGMKLTVPVIQQRPTAGVQSAEKVEVDSQKTIITAEDFNAITIAGAGDLSIQIIKRSSPSFLNLWMELLGEAYAIEAEDQAVLALLNSIGGVGAATSLDPEDLSLGAAFVASFDAIRRPPDTIWLSTQAVGEFIDAKADTTNQPLYPGLRASATAAGGVEGVISGLRPVHVPTLDAHGAYALVGPSSGFAWAEDGTFTLQVDVPATAGRDVAIVGILWPCPWYPAAFTAYNVASGA
jgi:HK97 family phage major capsid protein